MINNLLIQYLIPCKIKLMVLLSGKIIGSGDKEWQT